MKRPFNQLLCFLCLSVLPAWGWAQTLNPAPAPTAAPRAQSLSLRELLDAAASQNPDIRAARLSAQANAQDVTAVERLRWPTLNLTAESDTGGNATTVTAAGAGRYSTDVGTVDELQALFGTEQSWVVAGVEMRLPTLTDDQFVKVQVSAVL